MRTSAIPLHGALLPFTVQPFDLCQGMPYTSMIYLEATGQSKPREGLDGVGGERGIGNGVTSTPFPFRKHRKLHQPVSPKLPGQSTQTKIQKVSWVALIAHGACFLLKMLKD